MKQLFTLFFLSVLALAVKAQSKTTTLYELIKNGVPDSSAALNITDWKKGLSINPAVRWESIAPKKQVIKGPKKDLVSFSKNGSAKMILPNKKTDEVSINLTGNSSNGYSEISIDMSLVEGYNLEKLLANKNCSITLLKKDGDDYPFYDYKVKFPGKKEVWIMLTPLFPGTMMPDEKMSLTVIVLFDQNEYQSRKSN